VEKKINIAIDGYSSCGKSTLAKSLAKKLGYLYIDSGAMYRAITLYAMEENLIHNDGIDRKTLIDSLEEIEVDFVQIDGKNTTRLNQRIVESEIRTMKVSSFVSQVSKIPEVRGMLRKLQQACAINGGVVMDGRDIGSAVLPDAELKIFMVADPQIRAQRRFNELKRKGVIITLEEVVENLAHRDHHDTTRKENPLIQVSDARVLDNSHLNEKQQLELVLKWVEETRLSTSH
jgi:cytidylate kinase